MVSEEEFQRFIENDFESQEEFFEFLDQVYPTLEILEFHDHENKLVVLLSDEREISIPKRLIPFFLLENGQLHPDIKVQKESLRLHRDDDCFSLSLDELLDKGFRKDDPFSGFAFERLRTLDWRTLQNLLRQIDNPILALALGDISHPLLEIISENISKNRRTRLLEDLNTLGKIRPEDILYARHRIEKVAKQQINSSLYGHPRS